MTSCELFKGDVSISHERRAVMLLSLGGATLLLGGCTTRALRAPGSDGTYCVRFGSGHRHRRTCMPTPIPPERIEAEAKRFDASPGRLTVYLVRDRWGDTRNVVRISSDRGSAVDTVPESFARWRLPPGVHRLTAAWAQDSTGIEIGGDAGGVIFVELIGSVWAWGSRYRMERGEPTESRLRAMQLRLVADAE